MSSPWQVEVQKTREIAKQYRKVLNDTFCKQGTTEVIEDIEAGKAKKNQIFLKLKKSQFRIKLKNLNNISKNL
jgi:hypothetical protein